MKIFFSVNSPKIEKRQINRGEDAPVVNKDGIMIICDGTGATGQEEHIVCGETYTSAYLGSRETSRIAEEFLTKNYDRLIDSFASFNEVQNIVVELGDTLRNGLLEYVQENKLRLTVHGKSFKLLPTTFTAVVYKIYQTKIEAIVLCAGDSRVLWWEPDGLHQLSIEDSDNREPSVGDCNVNNCISADGDFSLTFSCYNLNPKGILLATSDGFTDPIQPFIQERYLIEWIGNFDDICEQNSQKLSAQIMSKMDKIGFTQRDDCSMAGVILGYHSEQELKTDFRKRYEKELIETYIKPYKVFKQQYDETEAELNEAKRVLFTKENQIVGMIKNGILNYLKEHRDTYLDQENLFQLLVDTDAISQEIRQENHFIESDRKEKCSTCTQKESELRTGYLEFLKMLCMEYGSVRFSDEVINSVQKYYEREEKIKKYSRNINKELVVLKNMPISEEVCDIDLWNGIAEVTERLIENVQNAKGNYPEYTKIKAIVDQYFNYQNKEIELYFYEDMKNQFAVLKKIPTLPIKNVKKRGRLIANCKPLLELYKVVEGLKIETTEENIQRRKTDSYTKIIVKFSRDIAKELFHSDKYWDFIPETKDEPNISELEQYKQLKKQLKSVIAQRENVTRSYHVCYEAYLLNSFVRGKVLFRKVGKEQYED